MLLLSLASSLFDRARVLSLAAQQPRRELAGVVLIYYPGAEMEEFKKQAWLHDLRGYACPFSRGDHLKKLHPCRFRCSR